MAYKNIYIVSDIHLNKNHTSIANLFKKFLDYITSTHNQLYILGDFFDYWIGDNHKNNFYHEVTDWLKNASDKGLEILFMYGNRDFLIGKKFTKQSSIKIIKDPFYLNFNNKKILLSHGDLFCTDDKIYQMYRKLIARNKILMHIFKNLPLFIREISAKNIRKLSHTKNCKIPNVDVTSQGIKKYLKDCYVVIHGHTHKLAIHKEKEYTRYTLGDWYKKGNYIKISYDGKITQVREIN